MEKINFETEVENEVVERKFREVAAERILQMNIPPFDSSNLELARSEKEIAKCVSILEKETHKKEIEINKKNLNKNKKDLNKNKKDLNKNKKESYKKIFKKVQGKKYKNK